jgi:hypothetical protein
MLLLVIVDFLLCDQSSACATEWPRKTVFEMLERYRLCLILRDAFVC